uniref:MFS general substrate transporter n=1 Tax=Moniliophthora roreri TaxID=221103 RepID=A0A0W0G1C8_MONRR
MSIGLCSIWLLPDYPNNTQWITPFERRLAQARLADDAGEADKDNAEDSYVTPLSSPRPLAPTPSFYFSFTSPGRGLKMAITDIKVSILAVMTTSQLLGLSFVNFFPTLTETLGFNTTISLLLAAPPWILATICCCLNAWHADRTGERFFHIAGWWWGVILGFIIALSTMHTGARYVSMFFMACGYVGLSMTLVWVSNILPRPPAKRAAAIGIVNGCGNIGNLIGAFTWKAEWGPEYHQSMIISLAGLALSTALALVIRQMVVRDNRKLDEADAKAMDAVNRARVEEAARLEGITFEEAMVRRRGFRYLY